MIRIAIENIRDLEEDIKAIIPEQRREIDTFGLVLSPNWEEFRRCDDLGKLICISAREQYRLIGYCVSAMYSPMEFSQDLVIRNSVLYVVQDSRAKGIGKMLIKKMEETAYQEYASVVYWHSDVLHTHLGDYLTSQGYTATDVVYAKKFKKED